MYDQWRGHGRPFLPAKGKIPVSNRGLCYNATMITPTVLHTSLGDNYIYLILNGQEACVVDPTAAEPVEHVLCRHHLKLKLILNTHHHFDHIAGNYTLRRAFGCPIIASSPLIPEVNRVVGQGDTIGFGDYQIEVMATPGHTRDHVCYYLPGNPGLLFSGDTLFVGGCGRLLDGHAAQLWASLNTLRHLPDNTLIYPGHEYTLDNYRFLLSCDPDNTLLQQRQTLLADRLHVEGVTIPTTMAMEKATNVFLQASSPQTFADLRRAKDCFS